MTTEAILIANRGEVAVRIMRAAAELGIRAVAVYSGDDADALHTRQADEAFSLAADGPAAYLDIDRVLAVAKEAGCDAVHPGYGFLSENAELARRCDQDGVRFIGPAAETLALFGDKAAARALARSLDVAVLAGTDRGISVEEAVAFLQSLGPGHSAMLKATAGGGGRGQRIVGPGDDLAEAYARCQSEASSFFGDSSLFAEQFLPSARHIEVQIIGDATGAISHLHERDCSVQRRFQKIVEVAPAPGLSAEVRSRLTAAAVKMASAVSYRSLGTFEFLVSGEDIYFIEANPRLQVEHTVTEEVLGIDLVQAQIQVAAGSSLADLGLDQPSVRAPRGFAIQARVNMETMGMDGVPRPGGGMLSAFELPSGPGIRTDTFGYPGYCTSPRFDSLLAKVIARNASLHFGDAVTKLARALGELRIEGVATNVDFLLSLLHHPVVRAGEATTRFVDDNMAELVSAQRVRATPASGGAQPLIERALAGYKVDQADPLAVLKVARRTEDRPPTGSPASSLDGFAGIVSPLQGTIVQVDVAADDAVRIGDQVAVMEAMKMEHVVRATVAGYVRQVGVQRGDAVFEGHPLFLVEPAELGAGSSVATVEIDLDEIRPDLRQVIERHAATYDEARPEAVAKRHARGHRTVWENINDLCDRGSFVEHGGLALTPGTGLPVEEVVRKFPTDGMVCGVGSVNGADFGADESRTVVLSYDYTVLAGTQGPLNHLKTDRMIELAQDWELPLIFFTEGGGGRAGTGGKRGGATEPVAQSRDRSLAVATFASMGRLSGHVPTIGVTSGYCFAGNASLLGMCDVIVATRGSTIGMGGPALIEGGGLGVFAPEEVGPLDVQLANGVVDIAVEDETEAVAVAKKYLSYFQGRIDTWESADQRLLRSAVPENRLRTYDIRHVIETVADTGSVLELRRHFGLGMVTALARVEGRPVGILANNPSHMAGAVDSEGAIKAVGFMRLLENFSLPLVVLCDTPGIMVGPESEKTGAVRHCNQLFITGSQLSVPLFMVVLRKAVGLGALAMAGGSVMEPFMTLAWPTGEFAGMGIEGQVKLGYRNELEAIADPPARLARYQELVAAAYERSKAVQQGVTFQVDDVIDPMDTRALLARGLSSVGRRSSQRPPSHRRMA